MAGVPGRGDKATCFCTRISRHIGAPAPAKTNDKHPALFYVGGDALEEGSEFLLITNQRFDATLTGVTKLPFGQK